MAFCRNCGNKLEDGVKFCPNCGTPTDGNVPSSTKLSKKKSKKGVLIAAIVALIALVGGAVWYFFGNQQNDYSLEGLAKAVVEFDIVTDFHEGLAFFEKGKKVGVINKMGDIIVEPTYDSDMLLFDCQYKDGKAMVCKNGKFGFIDKNGKEIIPCKFDNAIPFSEGLAAIEKEGKYGFIDEKGQLAIPVIYENVNIFSGGLASVEKNGKYGYINKKGETVIPFTYDYGESFNGEVTIVNSDCIINKEGKVIKKYKSGFIRDFSEGLAVYEKEENGELRYGFIDESGKLVIPQDYYSYRGCYGYFKDGYAVVYKYDAEKFGVIDKSGKTIIPFSFDFVEDDCSEGLFRVCKNEKTGYYDNKGKCIIPCKFDNANPFSEGLAAVKQDNSGGFIDKLGNWVIPSIYDEVHSFSEGLAVVEKDGIYGFIDKKGNSTFDIQDEKVKKIIQAKIKEKEKIRKEEERRAEEERKRNEEAESMSNYSYDSDYEEQSQANPTADIQPILLECQSEITTCQREIESLCRTYAALASQDVDMFKQAQMKSTFLNGVSDWVEQADRAFNRCAKKLKSAGFSDAESLIKEEKRIFHSAIYEIKSRAIQQAEMGY